MLHFGGTDDRVDWRLAQCRGLESLFFSDEVEEIDKAKAVCEECPLTAACLRGAFERREVCGVWGGQLFLNGAVLAQKRKRGRPRKAVASVA